MRLPKNLSNGDMISIKLEESEWTYIRASAEKREYVCCIYYTVYLLYRSMATPSKNI